MSQPSVTAYFNTRKRQANDELRSKAKVLLLDQEQSRSAQRSQISSSAEPVDSSGCLTPIQEEVAMGTSPKLVLASGKESTVGRVAKSNSVVRNIQFDSPKTQKASKTNVRPRATRSRKLSTQDGHTDIRESFLKINEDSDGKKVPFEKKGALSPKKKLPATPKKNVDDQGHSMGGSREEPTTDCTTPKKISTMDKLIRQDLSLNEIKNRINKSSRLMELKASIARIKNCEQRLDQLQKQSDVKKPQIQKFEKIQLEIPVSPQKAYRSPTKNLMSPAKNKELSLTASPQRRILFEPKETTPSPVKGSPTKTPAYQRYLSLAESGTPGLPLPYSYRFLAEAFRCVDTVSAMLYNRKEIITFKKLKPAVQELLRKNFTLEHLAQIKSIYPDAYIYNQEKHRTFGSSSKQDKYELVVTPVVEGKSGRNTPDADDVLKTASQTSMGPGVLLERRRKFYNVLLERVKNEHEKFLLGLENPMIIPKEKIMRWHPEFDVETCKVIEQSELPQVPNIEKAKSARDVLDKAKSLFNCGTRMEKALQRLAEAKMTSRSEPVEISTTNTESQTDENGMRKVDITVVDTPPATPTTHSGYLSVAFKGIPKALLEKVRAKQAAKALEAMTRTPHADKEAALYSRLPELAKIIRNIFVAEKKGVLAMEFVIGKLDNSFRTKLTTHELEEHIRLLCKLLPTWASIHNVRKVDYLKLVKDVDMAKVIKRLEIMANDKVKA
ncbi:hypothetical protein KM043_010679 [Ampulex compressa]|nr:hypothetical protein KM043_010679 [Ampulex compressa]